MNPEVGGGVRRVANFRREDLECSEEGVVRRARDEGRCLRYDFRAWDDEFGGGDEVWRSEFISESGIC